MIRLGPQSAYGVGARGRQPATTLPPGRDRPPGPPRALRRTHRPPPSCRRHRPGGRTRPARSGRPRSPRPAPWVTSSDPAPPSGWPGCSSASARGLLGVDHDRVALGQHLGRQRDERRQVEDDAGPRSPARRDRREDHRAAAPRTGPAPRRRDRAPPPARGRPVARPRWPRVDHDGVLTVGRHHHVRRTGALARRRQQVLDVDAEAGQAARGTPRRAASSPTRPTIATAAPARAAATAWLAPLPPKPRDRRPARTVSPGPGSRSSRSTTSRLADPTTRTRPLIRAHPVPAVRHPRRTVSSQRSAVALGSTATASATRAWPGRRRAGRGPGRPVAVAGIDDGLAAGPGAGQLDPHRQPARCVSPAGSTTAQTAPASPIVARSAPTRSQPEPDQPTGQSARGARAGRAAGPAACSRLIRGLVEDVQAVHRGRDRQLVAGARARWRPHPGRARR